MVAAVLFAAIGADGATLLEGEGIRLAFDTAEKGFNRIGMYYDSTSFKMPAVLGAVWRDFDGMRRYTVLVNISGDEQIFAYDSGAGRKPITIPPRSVASHVVEASTPQH